MQTLRLYLDTSVFGGCFDAEFREDSNTLFEIIRTAHHIIVLSEVVIKELEDAPVQVREILSSLPHGLLEPITLSDEILALRDAYLSAGIIGPRWVDDAAHVATATVARADAIVSWNFSHIVRLDKIKAYNQINFSRGYGILTIVTPKEVIASGTVEER